MPISSSTLTHSKRVTEDRTGCRIRIVGLPIRQTQVHLTPASLMREADGIRVAAVGLVGKALGDTGLTTVLAGSKARAEYGMGMTNG